LGGICRFILMMTFNLALKNNRYKHGLLPVDWCTCYHKKPGQHKIKVLITSALKGKADGNPGPIGVAVVVANKGDRGLPI
jgi:hypothetical protein